MVSIELGGKDRQLRYGINSVCAIEEKSNMGIGVLLDETHIGYNSIRLLLWGGLRHENKGLTTEMVGFWMEQFINNGGDFADLANKVEQALTDSGLLGNKKAEG